MKKYRFLFITALAFAIPSQVLAGWIFQDVPTEIMAAAKTARLDFTIDMPLEDVANRLQMMHTRCSPGQTGNVAVDNQSGLLVAWLTAATVSHIFEMHSVESKTAVTLYMNIKVETQKKVWPLLNDEWFVRGGKRCAQELLDQTG